jgi:hypothetical protein
MELQAERVRQRQAEVAELQQQARREGFEGAPLRKPSYTPLLLREKLLLLAKEQLLLLQLQQAGKQLQQVRRADNARGSRMPACHGGSFNDKLQCLPVTTMLLHAQRLEPSIYRQLHGAGCITHHGLCALPWIYAP